jgi:hypothetical protein
MGETDGFHGEKELGQGQESRADCVPGMCRAWGDRAYLEKSGGVAKRG